MDECRICKAGGVFAHHSVPEMMFGTREPFDYFLCSACGCLQIASIPEDLARFYPENYYSNAADSRVKVWLKGQRLRFDLGERSWLGRRMSERFGADACSRAIRLGHISRSDRILDVGGGSGAHLRPLRAAGFTNLLGIDAFVRHEVSEPGMRIARSRLRDVSGSFRLIMMHHSFEHMPDPDVVLTEALGRLAVDGFILIRIPVLGYGWRNYGVNWVDLDAPRHLFLHSRESMAVLTERHGLEIADLTFDSSELEIWGSEQYLRGIAHRSPKSHDVDPRGSVFSPAQISAYRRTVSELNRKGDSGRAAFLLRRARAGARC